MLLAAFLAVTGGARAQMRGPSTMDDTEAAWAKKPKTSEATGVERDGRYEETEVRHSWFSFVRPAEKTPQDQLARAEKFRTVKDYSAAQDAFEALVLTWPRAPEAALAQLGYADMLAFREKYEDAFEAYDKLIDKYLGSFDYTEVIEKQFVIAKLVMERRKARFLVFGGFKAPERAIPLFESILKHAPRWEGAAEAQYLIGEANENTDEFEMAVLAYMNTQHRYPDSPFAEKAAFRRLDCLVKLTRAYPKDEDTTEQAFAAAVAYLSQYPESDNAVRARELKDSLLWKRATLAFKRASFYDRNNKQPKAALMGYENFVRMYPPPPTNSAPTSGVRASISRLSAIAGTRIEKLAPRVEQLDFESAIAYQDRNAEWQPKEALSRYQEFLRKYPDSSRAEQVTARIQQIRSNIEKANQP